MDIQKIKIISNNICYGPAPSPTDKNNRKFKGSLCGGVAVGDVDLTEYI